MGYGSHEVTSVDGTKITIDEWIETHPDTYEFVSKQVDNYSSNNFIKSESVNTSNDILEDYLKNDWG